MPEAQSHPRVLFHKDGRHRVARNEAEEKAMGDQWSVDQPAEATMAIRQAAGSIAEIIDRPTFVSPMSEGKSR